MSKIFLLFLLCLSKLSVAQSVFATDGSEWYHELALGSLHSYVAGDTTIQGHPCKKIIQNILLKQRESVILDTRPLYVFTASDTTFVFNNLFSRFTPLYIFNAQEGDSICLPLLRPGACSQWTPGIGDSTFCFVVDSIRRVRYDTALLKTFYTTTFHKTNQVDVNWSNLLSGNIRSGAYVERVGSILGGILPQCWSCSVLAVGGCTTSGGLRCYRDEAYSIKLVSNDCNNGATIVSVNDLVEECQIRIFPIPAADYIYIENPTTRQLSQIRLYSTSGKLLLAQSYPYTNRIDTECLADGIYYLHIRLADHSSLTKKIIIQKN